MIESQIVGEEENEFHWSDSDNSPHHEYLGDPSDFSWSDEDEVYDMSVPLAFKLEESHATPMENSVDVVMAKPQKKKSRKKSTKKRRENRVTLSASSDENDDTNIIRKEENSGVTKDTDTNHSTSGLLVRVPARFTTNIISRFVQMPLFWNVLLALTEELLNSIV